MNDKRNDKNQKIEFFTKLKKDLLILTNVKRIESHLDVNTNDDLLEPTKNKLISEAKRISGQIMDSLDENGLKEETLEQIHANLESLSMAQEHLGIDSIGVYYKEAKKKIREVIDNLGERTFEKVTQDIRESGIEEGLAILYMTSNYLLTFTQFVNDIITKCLTAFQKAMPLLVSTLATKLEGYSTWGANLVASHAIFKGEAISKFSKLTNDFGIDFVLEHIESTNNPLDKDGLRDRYDQFNELYEEQVNTYLGSNNVDALISEIRSFSKKICSERNGMRWDANVKEEAIKLMAHVFALWTLQNAEFFFQAGGQQDHRSYLMQPRAAQVISIFRLLSMDDVRGRALERNLVEIGTGEGKSLTLAVASCILALLGYDVNCACYSEYLSRRDYKSYEDLFNAVGVAKDIHYGTFNELCERVINSDGNVRKLTEDLILPKGNNQNNSKNKPPASDEKDNNDDNDEDETNDAIIVNKPKILIIDEVDVFFNKEFFGNVYTPAATIRDPSIKALTDHIWTLYTQSAKQRKIAKIKKQGAVASLINSVAGGIANAFSNTINASAVSSASANGDDSDVKTNGDSGSNSDNDSANGNDVKPPKGVAMAKVKACDAYKRCCKVFGRWKVLLDEAIKDMLADIKTFKSTDYVLHDGKIGYKDGDGINTNAMLGYQTLWTYYYEHSKNKGYISNETLESKVGIYLKCGTFSYAEVPKKFDSIMGVTGTLKTLEEPERQIMEKTYGISKYTFMPSLFGKTKNQFNPKQDVEISEEAHYNELLKETIRKKLIDHGKGKERCVFVFFEDYKKLEAFYNCREFKSVFQQNTILLYESLTNEEKIVRIKRAPVSNKILLSTKVFGRGTDFQVRDSIVEANGGPHVIQTFVSEQISEEKQVRGRTARQGGDGSYSLVLNTSDLEKYSLFEDDIKTATENQTLYDTINNKRHDFFAAQYKENEAAVILAEKTHEQAENLLDALIHKNTDDAIKLLKTFNLGAGLGGTKVAVLVDATSSMGKLLQKAKNTVGTMFQRISEILNDNQMDPKCFQLQFIAYRNYNAKEDELLRYSGWCSNSDDLRAFLKGIEPSYGWQNEAIEVAFEYVHKMIEENDETVSEMILIGDAGANTEKEIEYKKQKKHGLRYWARTKNFADTQHYKVTLEKFKSMEIKINAFYLEQRAKTDFEFIANETGGQCTPLNMNDTKRSGEILTHLISQRVLDAAGGDALVEAYKNKFVMTA